MTGIAAAGKRRRAGRPQLTDSQAGEQAARIIDVATALHREVSDAELARRFGLTRRTAVSLVYKRQRHSKVVAFIGDSLEALSPKQNLLRGAARLALALMEADQQRALTGSPGEKPRMTLTAAIQRAALRVRVDGWSEHVADPASTIPKREALHGAVDVSGVRRAVGRIMLGELD